MSTKKIEGKEAVKEAQKVANMFKTPKEVISKFEFRGIITNMSQHEKKTKSVNEPHTTFTFACSPVDQKEFEDIMTKIALGGHCADIHIVTKTLEEKLV